MTAPHRLNRVSVAQQVCMDLRNRMVSGEIAQGAQLPSEPECCETYGVSRATVREAYKMLEQEGLIEVRPGIGRFVLSNVQRQIRGSVNNFRSMSDYLTSAGHEPITKVVEVSVRRPTETEAEMLSLAANDTVAEIERLRFSNDEPIVHSVNVFDSRILPVDIHSTDWSTSIVGMFRTHGYDGVSSIADCQAVLVPDPMADRFGLSKSFAWLRLFGVAFDRHGRPLWWSDDLMRGDIRTLRIINQVDPDDS